MEEIPGMKKNVYNECYIEMNSKCPNMYWPQCCLLLSVAKYLKKSWKTPSWIKCHVDHI